MMSYDEKAIRKIWYQEGFSFGVTEFHRIPKPVEKTLFVNVRVD